ncbi:hypothetical protein [Emticicia sp. 21SJ11W-3]|uniref:hypothetical protein n=1 Tax=Emticicia sp. 21SJ11W-3 TaxID=2916755 RepID=UPI0020A1A9E6|nr:hypothetical protein [Emticicia sp. 21SJ11W-3]UTA66175.1 hypothetical protein MB380_11185 [Emticicia sp. 21SJ11W-3]
MSGTEMIYESAEAEIVATACNALDMKHLPTVCFMSNNKGSIAKEGTWALMARLKG